MITPRFTIDGDPSLERHLDQVCNRVTDEVRACIPGRSLEGLLLGGGYGRGEGGVLKTASGDRPYNDLEFYVFVRGNAFLRNMVRIVAGTLVEVGEGRRQAVEIPEILASRQRERAGQTAPARGLCLMRVYYPTE